MTRAANDEPLFLWVMESMRARIENGGYTSGERLPSFSDLAAEFHVSNITVRRAMKELAHKGLVETRPRSGVFVSSRQPRLPAGGERVVAVIMQESNSLSCLPVLNAMEDECRTRGYHLLMTSTHADIEAENRLLVELSQQVAGFLVAPNYSGEYAAYEKLAAQNFPLVFIDQHLPQLPVPSVATDNVMGGYMATRHLLDLGRRNVCFIGQPDAISVEERFAGYKKALKEAGVGFLESRVYQVNDKSEAGSYYVARRLLDEQRGDKPIGVFAVNDLFARSCCIAVSEAGLRVPQDVAVVGYDDVLAAFCTPSLSSVRQNFREMGRRAARLLLDRLQKTPGRSGAKVQNIRLKPELIIRNSSDENCDFSLARHIASESQKSH